MNARSGCYNLRDGDFSANLPASEDRTPVLPPLIIVKAIRTTVRHADPTSPAPSGARVFVASAAAIPARRRHASSPVPSSPKTLNRGPFEIHVAYAVRFVLPPFPPPSSSSILLPLSLYLSSYLPYSVRLCATPRRTPRSPFRAFVPAALTCQGNSRDPSRAAIPGSLLAVARRVLFHFQ